MKLENSSFLIISEEEKNYLENTYLNPERKISLFKIRGRELMRETTEN